MCKLVFLTPKSIMTHKSYFKKWSHFLYIYMYTWNCHYYVLCLVARLCLTLGDPIASSPPGSSVPGDSRGKNTGVGFHALLQGIFPTQGSNPGLQHCRQILYHLEAPGKPNLWMALLIWDWIRSDLSLTGSSVRSCVNKISLMGILEVSKFVDMGRAFKNLEHSLSNPMTLVLV